jgi:predicted DNA-binding protein with PD1-like motif
MKTFPSGNETIIVLQKGETLMEVLNNYAKDHFLNGGWVNVIGGVGEVTLGYFDAVNKEYKWQEFNEFLEIVGLQGNLAWVDGEPFWHIHGVFSRDDYTTIAGHVKNAKIALTGEVYLRPHNEKLTRVYDDETGLKLLTEATEK